MGETWDHTTAVAKHLWRGARAFSSATASGMRTIDSVKKKLEPTLDNIVVATAAASGATAGAYAVLDPDTFSDPMRALGMAAAGGAVAAGSVLALQKDAIGRRPLSRWNNMVSKNRLTNYAQLGLALFAINTSAQTLDLPHVTNKGLRPIIHAPGQLDMQPTALNARLDARVLSTDKLYETNWLKPSPEVLTLGYAPRVQHNVSDVELMPVRDRLGRTDRNAAARVQRAERWRPVAQAVSDRYGLNPDILLGICMQESYCDPLVPNAGSDGGIGLKHMQGSTAQLLGLRIYGNSESAHDPTHGQQLKELFSSCDYDLPCIAQRDHRANPVVNVDAAARYMLEGMQRANTTDITVGVKQYRRSSLPETNTRYAEMVGRWVQALNSPEIRALAAEEFEKNNGYPIEKYWTMHHEMLDNWGLDMYRSATEQAKNPN